MISPVIVAIDKHRLEDALTLADQLDPALCRLKVGKELFCACGPAVVGALQQRGFQIFLDLKFHDIPNTTAQAVKAAADMGVWMTNVHASVGLSTMALCQERLQGYQTHLIAVTVLTSMTGTDLQVLGVSRPIGEQVAYLAHLAKQAGLYGVVCSAKEAKMLKGELLGQDFALITPGIRLAEDKKDDQQRICTPKQAQDNGADYLVIGRPITNADEPNKVLNAILAELSCGL